MTKSVTKHSKAKHQKAIVKTLRLNVPKEAYKKSQLLTILAEQTALSKKEVAKVLEAIQAVVHLVKNGPGQFVLPGLLKMAAKTKPVTKARK